MFDQSTFREPSQFERMKGELAIRNHEVLDSNITHVFQRADPAPRRRGRPRGSERARDRGGRGGRSDRDDQISEEERRQENQEVVLIREFVFIEETGQS